MSRSNCSVGTSPYQLLSPSSITRGLEESSPCARSEEKTMYSKPVIAKPAPTVRAAHDPSTHGGPERSGTPRSAGPHPHGQLTLCHIWQLAHRRISLTIP